jgi:hypothetical protein
MGHITNVAGNFRDTVHWFEILVAELQDAGRTAEADQVRNEIRRYQSQSAHSKP